MDLYVDPLFCSISICIFNSGSKSKCDWWKQDRSYTKSMHKSVQHEGYPKFRSPKFCHLSAILAISDLKNVKT